MRDSRVVVVGDLMLDRFLWGSVSRISPEAPVPVVRLQSESASLGGAGNVARNVRSLGGRVDLIGILGPDAAGAQFRDALRREELSDSAILDVPDRGSTVKTRVIAHHQQVVRIDRESTAAVPEEVENRLVEIVLDRLLDAGALLISDYDKGAVTPRILGRILPAAAEAGLVVAIDPKPANYEHYRPATVITPNAQEAGIMAALRDRDDAGLEKAGETIRKHLGCKAVLVTRGEEGMTLIRAGTLPLTIPASAREVFDVTGAGDTVISALTLSLVAGGTLEEAASLANAAAGCAVGKLGTAVVQPEEILRAFQV